MPQNKLVEFGRIDQSGDPNYFIRFLDEACAQESFRAYKQRTYELLALGPGQRVLDVGCGTGDDARDMAAIVGPGGKVVGLDNSQAMVDEAKRRAAGLSLPLEFHVGDAMHMTCASTGGFDDGPRPIAASCTFPIRQKLGSRKWSRVALPGGRVLVDEVDFETVTIDAPDRSLARRIVNVWCDGFRDGWLGRRMPRLFREAGLHAIAVVPMTLVLNRDADAPDHRSTDRWRGRGRPGASLPPRGEAWLRSWTTPNARARCFAR